MSDAATSDMIPEIPGFDLVRPIGEGAFGQVWLATNRATSSIRAVKLIPLGKQGRARPAARELTSLMRLEQCIRRQHQHLITIHHVGQTDEYLYYVMDPADNLSGEQVATDDSYTPCTLERRLRFGPLSEDRCVEYSGQLLEALASLHEEGMVHRDVKPSNCLIVDGEIKLADFGLLTDAGSMVSQIGTRSYMPPDGRMDAMADTYAAGLVIYEMLTGLPPEQFPSLGRRTPVLSGSGPLGAMNRLVLKACEPSRADRFVDACEMLREFEIEVRRGLSSEKPICNSRLSMMRKALYIVAACIVLIAGLLLYPAMQGEKEHPPRVISEIPGNRSVVNISSQLPVSSDSMIAETAETVTANFITQPFEAKIRLDGQLLINPENGQAYQTPCSVPGILPGMHDVSFEHDSQPEQLEAGQIDFRTTRQVTVSWHDPVTTPN